MSKKIKTCILHFFFGILFTSFFILFLVGEFPRIQKMYTGITPQGYSEDIGIVDERYCSRKSGCDVYVHWMNSQGIKQITRLKDVDHSVKVNDKVKFIYQPGTPHKGLIIENLSFNKISKMVLSFIFGISFLFTGVLIYKKR